MIEVYTFLFYCLLYTCLYSRVQTVTDIYKIIMLCAAVHQGYPREGDIRLVGDLTNGDGAVEYYRVGFGWLAVCPDSTWDDDDATVACRQLGYSDGLIANYE